MSNLLQIIMGICVIFYFFIIIRLIRRKTLTLKYTLLWIFAGIIMALLVIFPSLLNVFARVTGVYSPVNGLFAVLFFAVIIILMSLTAIASKQTERIKNLVQYSAFLEKRIRDLEKSMENKNDLKKDV